MMDAVDGGGGGKKGSSRHSFNFEKRRRLRPNTRFPLWSHVMLYKVL